MLEGKPMEVQSYLVLVLVLNEREKKQHMGQMGVGIDAYRKSLNFLKRDFMSFQNLSFLSSLK